MNDGVVVTATKYGGSVYVVIPKSVRLGKGIVVGDLVKVTFEKVGRPR